MNNNILRQRKTCLLLFLIIINIYIQTSFSISSSSNVEHDIKRKPVNRVINTSEYTKKKIEELKNKTLNEHHEEYNKKYSKYY